MGRAAMKARSLVEPVQPVIAPTRLRVDRTEPNPKRWLSSIPPLTLSLRVVLDNL